MSEGKLLIHRSAILSYKTCPYKAYIEYFYNEHGLSSSFISQHLLIGLCVHRGLQHLLEHCRVHHPLGDFEEKCIDDAVAWGLKVFAEVLEKKQISLKYNEDLNYTIKEISNLIEALIRVYAIYRLGDFLEEYEVLEVEKEEIFSDFSPFVIWLGKADGLLRRRKDNQLVVLSFKTASAFPNVTMRNILHDMQGVSEIAVVRNRLNYFYKILLERDQFAISYDDLALNYGKDWTLTRHTFGYLMELSHYNPQPKEINLSLVQYEFLIKGQHRKSSNPTHYQYSTHLLHALKNTSYSNFQLGNTLTFVKPQSSGGEYEWQIPQGKVPVGKTKVDIYDGIGVKEWIYRLSKGLVQPEKGDPFQDVIIAGEDRLISRSEDEVLEWRISTQYETEEIMVNLQNLNKIREEILSYSRISRINEDNFSLIKGAEYRYKITLMRFFRKNTQSCHNFYGDDCSHIIHCHEGISLEDLKESGYYQIRIPHHQAEVERFKEKGFLEDEK